MMIDQPLSDSLSYPSCLLFFHKEINDLQAVEEWRRDLWKERQRTTSISLAFETT